MYSGLVSAKASTQKIEVIFQPPSNPQYKELAIDIEKSNQFQKIADGISKEFRLPKKIKVIFSDQNETSYDYQQHTIFISYKNFNELIMLYQSLYPKAIKKDALLYAISVCTFLFYHELAHAFLDIYNIPAKSNIEATADNLAVIFALEFTNEGYTIVMDVTTLFRLLGAGNKIPEEQFWDEHLLNKQRFYHILCLTYGKYTREVKQTLIKTEHYIFEMIKDKGDYCVYSYKFILNSWMKFLSPHMR